MIIEFYHIDAFEVPNYEPIWRELIRLGIDARMVGVPDGHNTAANGWFDFEKFKLYCNEHEIPFTTNSDPRAHVAVTTQNADILREYACPRVRLMYGPIVFPKAWGLQAHSVQPFSAVLTHGPFYQQAFKHWLPLEKLYAIGYPRYDHFFLGGYQKEAIRKRWGMTSDKPLIVFLPTWDTNTGLDLFLPELIKLSERYQIVLRPHHCTIRLEPERMAKMHQSGLLVLEDAFELASIFAAADLIVSDVRSGALFEACMCQVPAVGMVIDHTEVDGWLKHEKIGDMLSLCTDPSQLDQAIQTALCSKEQAIARQYWSDNHVSYRDGTAANKTAQALIRLARAKKDKNINQLLTPAYFGDFK